MLVKGSHNHDESAFSLSSNSNNQQNVLFGGLWRPTAPRHDWNSSPPPTVQRRRRGGKNGNVITVLSCLVMMMMIMMMGLLAPTTTMGFQMTPITTASSSRRPSIGSRPPPSFLVGTTTTTTSTCKNGKNAATARTATTTKAPQQSKLRMSLQDVSDFYMTYPVQSAVLTCGVKASLADGITQLRTKTDEIMSIEMKRNLAYTVYGGIFVGFMCHLEYDQVFPVLFGTEQSMMLTLEKVLFDNFVSAPLMWIPPAYIIKSLVFGNSMMDGLDKYVSDVRNENLLQKYWSVWLPAQTLQFSIIPPQFQVAFLATISFFWFMMFSHISSKEQEVEQVAEQQQTPSSSLETEQVPAVVVD